jgi:hypothetical protein
MGAPGQSLKQIAKSDLPGPLGKRFDYLTIDDDEEDGKPVAKMVVYDAAKSAESCQGVKHEHFPVTI